jgi:hypothetical protein
MASNINPNNINGNYPVAGQDNDSQGFRDNFTNISNNFSFAATEITGLQNSVTNLTSTIATNGNVTAYYANVTSDLLVGGTTAFNGDVNFNANVLLSESTLSIPSYIAPSVNLGYDIGTAALKFGNVYGNAIIGNAVSATTNTSTVRIENINIVASAATATQNISALTSSCWYFTANANANVTLNFVGSTSSTLANILPVGNSARFAVLMTQGATAYLPTLHQIDGVTQTIKWINGTAPTAGNTNTINVYDYTITKTSSAPTYLVLAAQSKYA